MGQGVFPVEACSLCLSRDLAPRLASAHCPPAPAARGRCRHLQPDSKPAAGSRNPGFWAVVIWPGSVGGLASALLCDFLPDASGCNFRSLRRKLLGGRHSLSSTGHIMCNHSRETYR